MNLKLAKRMTNMESSAIRDLLKLTQRPEVISFAGGLPAPELFPITELLRVNRLVLEEQGQQALQYSTTEGYPPLREWVAARLNRKTGTAFAPDDILIVHGSQQALDLTGKLFLDEGDVVLCESPTYLAALSAYKAYGCRFVEVETDGSGMVISDLRKKLQEEPRAKLIYAIPDFQNPTGRTWSRERRQGLAEASAEFGVAVLEDNPYGELRFEGEFLPPVKAFDRTGNVLSTGTFSKIFCPGYRLGWIAGDQEMIRQYVLLKQAVDLQCNTLAQMEVHKYVELYDIDAHVEKIRQVYKHRRDLMLSCMEERFPSGVTFTRPQGGLFLWVTLPDGADAKELLKISLKRNVAFVPGGPFFPEGGRENDFRMNFSNMTEERIPEGVKRLGEAMRELLGAN